MDRSTSRSHDLRCPGCGAQLAVRVGRSFTVTIGSGITMSATGALVCVCGRETAFPELPPLPPVPRYETRHRYEVRG
jgi:hypothetical protein